MAKYANYQKFCDGLFVIFTVIWIATRLGLFPFWIIRNTTIDAPKIVDMFPAYYIFNSLLFLLLTLHIFWTYLILKIAYNSVLVGKVNVAQEIFLQFFIDMRVARPEQIFTEVIVIFQKLKYIRRRLMISNLG